MPLVLIGHDESNLGLSRLYGDVAATRDDDPLSRFLHHRHQDNVLIEIDV